MRLTKVKDSLLLLPAAAAALFVLCGVAAAGPLLVPLAAGNAEISPEALIEQLSSIPDYSITMDTIPVTEADLLEMEEGEDAEAYIFISSALAQTPAPVNFGGNGSLTLTRYDNGEKLTVRYRRKDGTYDPEAFVRLDHHMRCSLTGRQTHMAVKLVELLDAVEDKFGKKGLTLLSAYRTPKNNGKTPGSARHSLHMLGWAADIRIPGYSSAKVRTFARKLWAGGIGYYPYKGFVHLDVGKARYWAVGRPPRKRRVIRRAKQTRKVALKRPAAAGRRAAAAPKRAAKPARTASGKTAKTRS
ncbi:MAG: DUF882 domain-containing protein [Elusimicrobiales bacterium]|nr:DUF882 domain-containing protein [Elusimicrobiales bacterium]